MTQLIAGIVRLDGQNADPNIVHAMLDEMAMSDRPMSRRVEHQGAACFGCLAIGADVTPTIFETDHGLITADARLYGDLRPDDLPQAFADQGHRAITKLHGDIAAAWWQPSTERLVLIRDHMGVRPLQYTVRPEQYCAFASLPQAILRTGLAQRTLDPETLATYPGLAKTHGTHTFFEEIKSVEAAHAVTITPSHPAVSERVWRLSLGPFLPALGDRRELAGELRRLLEQAAKRRLPSDGPAFGHLSGGLDSSPLAVIGARTLRERQQTYRGYSFQEDRSSPDIKPTDEKDRVDLIASTEPNLQIVPVHPHHHVELLPSIDPDTGLLLDPREFEEQVLIDAAVHGADRIMSGWGGDEVTTFRANGWGEGELFWNGQWRGALAALRAHQGAAKRSLFRLFATQVILPKLPNWVRHKLKKATQENYQVTNRFSHANKRKDLSEFVRGAHYDSRQARRIWLEHWWIEKTLEIFAQRGARHGISYVYPMMDLDLLKFAVRLPKFLSWNGSQNRLLYREAIADLIPQEVLYGLEKLSPFPAHVLRVSQTRDELIAEAMRLQKNQVVQEYIDIEALTSYLSALASPEEIKSAINDDTGQEVNPLLGRSDHEPAMELAYLIEKNTSDRV